jgi:hypothetical protein
VDLNPRERNLENYLRTECRKRDWLCIKVGQDGWADDVVITDTGAHGWIELKRRKGGRVAPLQALRAEEMIKRRVWMVFANTEAKVDAFLTHLEQKA